MSRNRILILGGGFAGAYCASYAESELRHHDAELLLLNEGNYFAFYPLLVEAGTGSLEPRHAVVSLRSFLRATRFRMARVVDIQLEERRVDYEFLDGRVESESYDHLVLALGSTTSLPEITGLREFAFTIKDLGDAVALRDRAVSMLELADATSDLDLRRALLHFVVVGGNYTGVEVAGELDFFLRQAASLYPNLEPNEHQVSLIELQERILPALDSDLAEYARLQMQARGIHFYLQNSASEIGEDRVILESGESLSAHTSIWAAGIAPNPLISRTALPTDEKGYILCERNLRVHGFDNVWAIGDCAVNTDARGVPYPATAQHAIQEGRILAKNLGRALEGKALVDCNIKSKGTLAALGCRTAVAKVFGVKISGFWAWWLWRTIYLIRMPTWSRKFRVALDWTMDFLFSRDYVQLGIHDRRSRR